jgi:hypothetical protein
MDIKEITDIEELKQLKRNLEEGNLLPAVVADVVDEAKELLAWAGADGQLPSLDPEIDPEEIYFVGGDLLLNLRKALAAFDAEFVRLDPGC